MEKSWEVVMGNSVRKLLEVVLKKVGVPFSVGSVKINSADDIEKGVEYVLNVDAFVSVRCPEKNVWLSIYSGNGYDEVLSDYSDNEICNAIADEYWALI